MLAAILVSLIFGFHDGACVTRVSPEIGMPDGVLVVDGAAIKFTCNF